MSEEDNNEMLLLLKTLVDKVNKLENAVYDKDNILMKSGYVVVDTPTPSIDSGSTATDVDRIAKMDWEDIGKMVSKLEGGY
ncbi:MAG: hypothetical protein GOVbin1753_38 [Prokaryotic dsDNA virus sp.]|nr:MAG: hypothetical protein GOVbin1753_38 [Prokaryotic dsDNA virus sp.]|tara:strand:+ start:9434 stop:9676 length:243 start_codon:yes stop_codon:yes gene_type:complete